MERVETLAMSSIIPEASSFPPKVLDDLEEEFRASGGMVYPLIVTLDLSSSQVKYKIRDGRKRHALAQRLGWKEINAVTIPLFEDSKHSTELIERFTELVARLQRKELTDYEIGKAACELKAKYGVKGGVFAEVMGVSPGYSYNLARWYNSMPPIIREAWKNQHPLINQSELERMSQMLPTQIVPYFQKRLTAGTTASANAGGKRIRTSRVSKRGRKTSEAQLLKLLDAISHSALNTAAKELATNLIKFALGVSPEVPGITDYKKLPPEILAPEVLNNHTSV